MTDFEIEMRGRVIALSYLVEVALGSILAANPNKIRMLQELRFSAEAQLHSDIGKGMLQSTPSLDADAVARAATLALQQQIDSLLAQFSNQPPHRHQA